MNKIKKIHVLLILIILFGLFLRFFDLGKENLWVDESATAYAIKNYDVPGLLKNTYSYGNIAPPLSEQYYGNTNSDVPIYYLITSLFVSFLGLSEFGLRLSSAIAGSLSIIIVYLISKEILNRRAALIGSLLFSINLIAIEYSQEARAPVFTLLFALLSSYFLLKSIKSGRVYNWTLFTVFTLMGLYTHIVFVFFVVFEVIYCAIICFRHNNHIKKMLIAFLIIGILFLPLLLRLFALKSSSPALMQSPTFGSAVKLSLMFNSWLYPSPELMQKIYSHSFYSLSVYEMLLIASVILTAVIMFAFFLKNIFSIIAKTQKNSKRKDDNYINPKLFLLLWLFVPMLLQYLISVLHPSIKIFGPIRYLIFCIPAYLILISKTISELKPRHLKLVLFLIVVLSVLPISAYYMNPHKQQWSDVALYIKENIKPGEIILFNVPSGKNAFSFYYGDYNNTFGVPNANRAAELSRGTTSLWFVSSLSKYSDPENKIKNYLDKNYYIESEKKFFDIGVYYYSKNTDG